MLTDSTTFDHALSNSSICSSVSATPSCILTTSSSSSCLFPKAQVNDQQSVENNVNEKNNNASQVKGALSVGGNKSAAGGGGRKRLRAPLHLSRIDLSSAVSQRLSASNESLNSNASSSGFLGAGSSSDDNDCLTPTLSVNGDDAHSHQVGKSLFYATSGEECEKRLRLCSQQLSSPSATAVTVSAPSLLRVSSSASSTVSSSSSSSSDECYDLAELECSNSGASSSTGTKCQASGGLLIGDGEFELVGDGRECKAVNIRTQVVFHCQVLKAHEYRNFLTIAERIISAEKLYNEVEHNFLKCLLIPDGTCPIRGENGLWYVLLPDHHGNLHSLIQTRYHNASSPVKSNHQPSQRVFSERRIQPIFKQIVSLVEFCHRIGIFFRDFRLRKFVFTDRERTQIRFNNLLDLWVAPDLVNDEMTQRHVCPAYVAPEILDVRASPYAGRPADVWSLGVLMFILLIGRYPFYEANPNPTALFKRIKARRFSFPVNNYISPHGRWLLYGLLHQNPFDRPTAAEILKSHWLQAEPATLPDGHDHCPVMQKCHDTSNASSPTATISAAVAMAGFSSFTNNLISNAIASAANLTTEEENGSGDGGGTIRYRYSSNSLSPSLSGRRHNNNQLRRNGNDISVLNLRSVGSPSPMRGSAPQFVRILPNSRAAMSNQVDGRATISPLPPSATTTTVVSLANLTVVRPTTLLLTSNGGDRYRMTSPIIGTMSPQSDVPVVHQSPEQDQSISPLLEFDESATSSSSGTTAANNSKSTEKCRNGSESSSGCGSAADQLVPDIVVTSDSRESDGSDCSKNPVVRLQATAVA